MKKLFSFRVEITETGFSATCEELNMVVESKPTFEDLRDYTKESVNLYWEEKKKEGEEVPDYVISYYIIPYIVECDTYWDSDHYFCENKTEIPLMDIFGEGKTQEEAKKAMISAYYEISDSIKAMGMLAPLCVFKFK